MPPLKASGPDEMLSKNFKNHWKTVDSDTLSKEDRFLRNPVIWLNSKVKDLKFIKEKICSKIEGWCCKLLSQARRSTLICVVAQSPPTGNVDKDRFLALLDWSSLCLPLDRGGLNFKKFEDINLAIISKLGWKLAIEDDSLWCKVFKVKYWVKRINPFVPKKASVGAKGIMATRDLIRNEACWLTVNGRRADLWHSPWITWLDWNMSRDAFNPLIEQNSVKVSTLIGSDGEWIPSLINRWFVPSVLKITERLKLFLWKLCKDILPFGCRLERIFGNSISCAICGEANDSAQHMFWSCPLAKAVWFASRWSIRRVIDEFNRFGICLVDELCTARNRAFHDHVNPSWRGVMGRVQKAASYLLVAWDTQANSGVMQLVHREIYFGKLVLFVDASFKDMRVAAGIVNTHEYN
ncbi:hypothetical protein F8388_020500 [Cannabis sativa]|uniref:Reverse transcriptase zinc-binding domain-containing protein n=1 Tax=Cannabis sativa TaxID=3483 RepID=A0A7J6EX39_CANSA|nr:hypothetical protein F8388_020500 [Cannabis sativa]